MNGSIIPFLNLEYFFCILSSWFGQACSKERLASIGINVDTSGIEASLNSATSTVSNAANGAAQSTKGFWSWLWPFGNSGAASATGSDIGFWAGILHALPAPVQSVLVAVGTVLAVAWTAFSWLSYSVSGLLFMLILSSLAGLVFIRLKEWGAYGTLPPASTSKSYGWSRWQDLLNETMSTDPKRWRASIIAADGMLGELLTKLGYHGETTGDQMRAVPEDAFVTLPAAWEAHRIKNFVAARSSDFILTQREAFRVMKLYEQVFEEFSFI